MIEALKDELEATYGEVVDVLSRRLESVWDLLREMQRDTASLKEKVEAAREGVEDLRQAFLTCPLQGVERELIEAKLAKLEGLLGREGVVAGKTDPD